MKDKIINKVMSKNKQLICKSIVLEKEHNCAIWEQYTNGVYIVVDDPVFIDELATNWVLAMNDAYNNRYNGEYDR